MKFNLRLKILRVLNYGVLSATELNEKKDIQIYNTFLIFTGLNMFVYSVILYFYKFMGQFCASTIMLILVLICMKLNKQNYVKLSKVLVLQFFIIAIFVLLILFRFDTLFVLYFITVILFTTILFDDKESKIKFIIIGQCVFLFFVSITPLHLRLPNYEWLPKERIPEMNGITLLIFTFFLFNYIYFQTKYQLYKEKRYRLLNKRLAINNNFIKSNNIKMRLQVTTISKVLITYFDEYGKQFDHFNLFLKDKDIKNNNFLDLELLHEKIDDLVDFQFSNNDYYEKEAMFLLQIDQLNLWLKNEKLSYVSFESSISDELHLHENIFYQFLKELFFYFHNLNHYKQISCLIEQVNPNQIKNTDLINTFEVFGIRVVYSNIYSTTLNLRLQFNSQYSKRSIYRFFIENKVEQS